MENFAERLEKLEKDVENIKTQIRKKAEKQKLTLQEKFDIHDRAQRLLSEFEAKRFDQICQHSLIDTCPMYRQQIHREDEIRTIVKCFVELIDHALGIEFP